MSPKVSHVQTVTVGSVQYTRSVTWLIDSHTAVPNDKLLLQKVTKVCFKWLKNKKFKEKTAVFHTNYTEISCLTIYKYKTEFIFWFGKMSQNFEFSEKAD